MAGTSRLWLLAVGCSCALSCGEDAGRIDGAAGDGVIADVGFIRLSHVYQRNGEVEESLYLHACFYAEPHDPELDRPDYVETRSTPDGITCDIYDYPGKFSTMDTLPAPPSQVDGGRIQAWGAGGSSDALNITFNGEHYGADFRPAEGQPLPSWLGNNASPVTYRGDGTAGVAAFEDGAVLPLMPAIVTPAPVQELTPVPPDRNGNFLIKWQPTAADFVQVHFRFELGEDESSFICHPPEGIDHLLLPQSWLDGWPWGTGHLSIEARNEQPVPEARTTIITRTSGISRQVVTFELGR